MTKSITLEFPDGSVATRGGVGPRMLARFGGDLDAAQQHILDELVPTQNPGAVARIENVTFPPDKTFRNAWTRGVGKINVDMPKARVIHAKRLANAQTNRIARLKVKEAEERLLGNMAQADSHAADLTALEALDLNVLAIQIGNAANPTALSAIWPAKVPR